MCFFNFLIKIPLFCHFNIKNSNYLYLLYICFSKEMDPLKLLAKFTQKIANLNKKQTQLSSQQRRDGILNVEKRQVQLDTPQNNRLIDHSDNKFLQQNNIGRIDQVDLISQERIQQKQIPIQQEDQLQQNEQNKQKVESQLMKQKQDQQAFQAEVDQNLKKSIMIDSNNEDLLNIIKMKIQRDGKNFVENSNINNSVQKAPQQTTNKVCKSLAPLNNNGNNNGNNHGNQNSGQDKTNSLTDGRQYDEPFRRKFVKKLMKSLSTENPEKINQLLRNAAHTIQVHLYEVKIWLTSYKLIFNIEKYISQKQGNVNQNEKLNLIKRELLSFLQKNKNQKRYRIVKILNYLFQTFGFTDIKTHAWVNQFTNQYYKELKGMQITQNRNNKTRSNDGQSQDQQRKQDKNSKKNSKIQKRNEYNRKQKDDSEYEQQSNQLFQIIPLKKKNKSNNKKESTNVFNQNLNPKKIIKPGENTVNYIQSSPLTPSNVQDISMYPLAFKKKMSQKINNQIVRSIQDIIKSKSEEFCLSFNTIKCIYQQNGDFIIKRKSEETDINEQNKSDRLQKSIKRANQINVPENTRNLNQKGVISQKSLNPISPMNQSKTLNNKSSSFLHKNPQVTQNKSSTTNGSKMVQNNVPENIQNQNLLQKLEMRLLSFLRSNPNCYISVVQKQTQTHMEQNKFSEKLKNQVRNQWFCHFLRKNKYSIAPDRRVIKFISQVKHQLPVNQRAIQGAPLNRPSNPGQMNPNLMNMKQVKPSHDQNASNRNYYMN